MVAILALSGAATGAAVGLVAALVWANSPWQDSYVHLWETHFAIELGHLAHIDLSLRDWVNDAAMAVFFFVVGMEIKRELVAGELRDPRAAALPAIAAVGGMLVPALLYLAFNAGQVGAKGWGIPMATDIAFAAGVVALLGRRVPAGAKLFLLTLAIVDDLGAIVVIAVFYSAGLAFNWLALAVGTLVVTYLLRRSDVRSLLPYLVLGIVCWYALHESGVHATLAGVAFGLLTPVWSFFDPKRFAESARPLVDDIERDTVEGGLDHDDLELYLIDHGLDEMGEGSGEKGEAQLVVRCAFEEFGHVQKALEERGIAPLSATHEYIPGTATTLGEAEATEVMTLLDKLEQDEDVQNVYHTLA